MEFRQIKYFMEVARREHVTDAANALHIAQSAVSRQIFNLEEELGVALFIREGRTVRLTRIGKVFFTRMEKAMNVMDDAAQIVQEYTDPQKGMVYIGFPTSLASYILPTVIYNFRKEYPEAQIKLHQGSYKELVDAVKRGDIDIALLGPLPTVHEKIKSTPLFTEEIVALLPTSHPLANRSSLELSELQNDPFILFPEGFVLRDVIMEGCLQRGFKPKIAFEGMDMDAVKGLVSAGLGVTLIPEVTLVDCLPRSTVKVKVTDPELQRTVGVTIPKDRSLLPTEQLFYEFIKAFFTRIEYFQQ